MSYRSWLIRCLFVAMGAFCLFGAVPNASAEPEAASITISSILGEATVNSVRMTVTGSGFTCPTNVLVSVRNSANNGPSYTVTAVNKGAFSQQIDIPINNTPDVWTIGASQLGVSPLCSLSASARYYAFGWSVTPALAAPGSTVQVTGSRFPPNRVMPLGFRASNNSATSFGNVTANGNGQVSRSVVVPTGATVGFGRFSLTYATVPFGNFDLPLTSSKTLGVPTDLSIAHLETVQVIQRWDNSVPMVLGKATVVRVYVQANGPPGPLAGNRVSVDDALLDVSHNQTLLGTLRPIARPLQVAPLPFDARTQRGDAAATFNFLIPSSWTFVDGISLVVRLNTANSTPDTNHANDSTSFFLRFLRTKLLNIEGLMYAAPNFLYPAVPYTNYNDHLAYLRRTWPVSRVILHKPASPALTYTKVVSPTAADPYYPGSSQLIADAEKRRNQATDASKNYNWYILQPWNTCICGLSDFPPVKSSTGQDNRDAAYHGVVMAQEIGHNYNQWHTGLVQSYADPDCCPDGGISQNTNDPAFGFDTSTMQVVPPVGPNGAVTHDFMSYGGPPVWISDYTYVRLIAELFLPEPPTAVKETETVTATQSYLFVSGVISAGGALDPTYLLDLPVGSDDGAGAGEYALEERDAADDVLFTRNFDLNEETHHEDAPVAFHQVMPFAAGAVKLVLRHGAQVLATLTASANAPSVTITKPQPGVHWNGARQVTWDASDLDGDPLVFAVHYSSDNGQTWQPLAVDLTEHSLDLDAGLLKGSRSCLVRVIASDGLRTTVAQSGVFGVDPHQPTVALLAEPMVTGSQQLILSGEGYDADDGPLPDTGLVWASSRDGVLGTGPTLASAPVSPGLHLITLTGADLDGNQAAVTTTVQVGTVLYLPVVEN